MYKRQTKLIKDHQPLQKPLTIRFFFYGEKVLFCGKPLKSHRVLFYGKPLKSHRVLFCGKPFRKPDFTFTLPHTASWTMKKPYPIILWIKPITPL